MPVDEFMISRMSEGPRTIAGFITRVAKSCVDVTRLIKGTRGITKGVRQRRGVLVAINFQRSHITGQNVCRNKNRTLAFDQRECNYKAPCARYPRAADCSLKGR